MTTTNKPGQNPQENKDENSQVKEGKKAIEAQKITDPKPKEQQEKEEQEDAEQWRNEG